MAKMHKCNETRERITELALDGADIRSTEVAAALGQCSECRAEFAALSATLRLTSGLRDAAAPAESYWTGYHHLLRKRLLGAGEEPPAEAQRRKDEFGPLFASSFAPLRLCARFFLRPIPVPLGAAALVTCSLLGLVVFAASRQPDVQPQVTPHVIKVPVEVQVPVTREKIVAKIVYRDRRSRSRNAKQTGNDPTSESTLARSQKPGLPADLAGFKPNEEVKLTVIKGGAPNEK
jgi:anti-sigma factor RsiW